MNLQALMNYLDVGGDYVVRVLAVLSVVMIAVCLERLFMLYWTSVDGEWLLQQMAVFLSHNRISDAIEVCQKGKRWLLARVFQIGLYRAHCSREDILDAMSVGISDSTRVLEANLSILGTIAVIAPFVGLFGTVLGIIQAFHNIAVTGKTGIASVGEGVAEALVTTAAGLFVAIISVCAFNFFKSKVKRAIGEITDYAARMGELLYFTQNGVALPGDLTNDIPQLAKTEGKTENSTRS
jgi:biopolymer transport protein ExbB